MESYLDIRGLPDPEFSIQELMDVLFAKFHWSLSQLRQCGIGVSFPHADKTLGDILRLHGTAESLSALQSLNWLKGLQDYTEHSGIQAVPTVIEYRVVRRVQVKSNAERLRRRSVKKGWLTVEEALVRIPDSKSQFTALPFLNVKSTSTGQSFRLFIDQSEASSLLIKGTFSLYGLSHVATVPWF